MLLALASVALWAVIATIETISRDGYRAAPFDIHYDTRLGSAAPVARTF
jgi:hypothetical protein